MKPRSLFAVSLLVAGAAALMAQTQSVSDASTPSACLKATRDFQQARMKEAGAPMTQEKYQLIQRDKAEFARGCIARFAIDTLPADELAPLAELHIEAGQPDLADKAVARALDATGTDAAVRAKTLVTAVRLTMRQPKSDARNAKAEQLVDQIESLPPSFARERIDGHAALNSYYRADDIDAGIITHSTRLIQLNTALTPEQRAPADELAAIREYFPRHGIVWPIAVSDNIPMVMENGRPLRKVNVNDANYKVAGIPQIHVIDRKGVVRLIMIGFDEANEARLAAIIGRLVGQ